MCACYNRPVEVKGSWVLPFYHVGPKDFSGPMTALLHELKPKSHTSYTFLMLFLLRFDIFLWAHYKCVARKSRLSHTLCLESSSKLLD